jgi:hypothetical protein
MPLLAVLVTVGLVATGLLGPAKAQTTYVDEDGTVAVEGNGTVDCDGTGTSAESSLKAAVDAGATDIDVCGGTYAGSGVRLDIGTTGTRIEPVASAAPVVLDINASGAAPIQIDASDVMIRNIEVQHAGSGASDATSTIRVVGGDNTTLEGLTITRSSLTNTNAAIKPGGTNLTVSNCDITGGPIGGGAEGTYRVEGNTIRGTGDEGIWMTGVDEAYVLNNTVERTDNGDASDDQKGIAVYGATSLTLEGNTIQVDGAAFLLGNDISILHDGSTTPLKTAADMRAVLGRNTVNGASPGKVTFVAQADGTLRANEGDLHIVRTGVTNVPGKGGAKTYEKSALQVAQNGDVVHLTDGNTYAESVTLSDSSPGSATQDTNVGFAAPASGSAALSDLTIDGAYTVPLPSGEVTVASSLTLGDGSTLDRGPIVLGSGVSFTDNGLASGSIKATRTVSGGQTSDFGGIGLTITDNGGGTPPGPVTVIRTDGDPVTMGDESIGRYYDVTAGTESGLNVDLTFGYDDPELGGREESNLALFRSDNAGSTWAEIPTDAVDANANTLTSDNLSSLSRFTAARTGAALPVELTAFAARPDGRAVVLEWTTASETNNAGFRVQRRTEAGFETIHEESGAGTATQSTTYRHRVSDLEYGTHTFRLQQVDRGGTTTLSDPVHVDLRMNGAFELSKVSPNPVSSRAQFDLVVQQSQNVTIDLYDALGWHVTTLHDERLPAEARHQFSVRAQDLSNGSYFVRVRGTHFEATRRLVVIK